MAMWTWVAMALAVLERGWNVVVVHGLKEVL